MPNILGQMMCRYQLWGAALSALLVGISRGFAFLNVLFSLLAAGMVGNQLLQYDHGRSPQLHQIITSLAPDDGWIMLCMAAVVLFIAVGPGRIAEDGPRLPAIHPPKEEADEDLAFIPADEQMAESQISI